MCKGSCCNSFMRRPCRRGKRQSVCRRNQNRNDVADGSIADGAKFGAMLGCVIGFVVLYAALEWIAVAAYNTAQAANEAGVCKWMLFLK